MNLLERFLGTLQAIIDYQTKCLQEDKERRLNMVKLLKEIGENKNDNC